jgi:hypothetical protein
MSSNEWADDGEFDSGSPSFLALMEIIRVRKFYYKEIVSNIDE